MLQRDLTPFILKDLEKKIVLISGPRQAGKTTLSKGLFPNSQEYLNFDRERDRAILRKEEWRRDVDLVVFDEIHKMKLWKRWIKGIYDTEGVKPRLLVTGSARLDTYRSAGDSLAGRFFLYRLHPLSLAEIKKHLNPPSLDESLDQLMQLGGFPEPFLSGSEVDANRWRSTYLDRILREDLLDLEKVREIKLIEILVELLSERVSSSVSYSSLAKDLQVSPHTVKKWVGILERLFIIFVVTPYSKNIAYAILKEPKIYFYDTGRVKNESGARFENLVACSLLKRNCFLEDTLGEKISLHYIKDHLKREVDFVCVRNSKLEVMVEAKVSDTSFSKDLIHYSEKFSGVPAVQLVKNEVRERQSGSATLQRASKWLAQLEG